MFLRLFFNSNAARHSLLSSVVLFIISLVKSLYNNIFTDEGYLSLTIPKSLDTLLISKFIAYFCWLFVYSIACFLGVLLISFSLETTVNDLFDDISIVFELLRGRDKEIFFKLIEIFISSVLSLVMLVLTFACVNTGVFKKAKVICGILIFLFLEYAISIITLIFERLSFGIGLDANQHLKFVYGSVYSPSFIEAGVSSYAMNFTTVIINLGLIFGFYFLIKYIIKNHLELE